MFKTIAFATLMAASCGAHAVTTWNFSYTGFLHESTYFFDDARVLQGSFSGDDTNGDGYVGKDEITSFSLNGVEFLGCAGDSNEFYQCGTDTFEYQIGGGLAFSAGQRGEDPYGGLYSGHYYTTGDREFEYRFTPFESYRNDYLWTEQTQFAIDKVAVGGSPVISVPEPGTWAMLATGLLLVTGMARRRRQAEQPIQG